jgi:DNA-binding MarR family transcriptional regulator
MKSNNCRDFTDQYLQLCSIAKKLDDQLRETLNISYNDFLVLDLAAKSVRTQKQIAQTTSLSQAGVSKIIFKLSGEKLISLVDQEKDRRCNIVVITELGIRKLRLATSLADEIVNNHIS